MHGAVPCLSADLTTHAVPNFIQALKMGRTTAPKARGAEGAERFRLRCGDERVTRDGEGIMGEGAKRGRACSPATCEVLFGAQRPPRARRRTICSPARCSAARVGVGEGAGARCLQSGAVAMCSSARVGVGEGAEACSSINSGRPGALLGSSVALGSGCR